MVSKYHNHKITDPVTGDVFDSRHEYNRWLELVQLEKLGKITDLKRQVSFELLPAQYDVITTFSPKKHKPREKRVLREKSVIYVADFVYLFPDGRQVVEDAKGIKTDVYIIKRKMMRHMLGIVVQEV